MSVDSTARVALVSMPWDQVTEPPLGLSVLRACLSQVRIHSRVFHFGMSLLRYLRYETYKEIAPLYAINDFIFSGVLDSAPMTQYRFKEFLTEIAIAEPRNSDQLAEKIIRIRELVVPKYLADCMTALISESPTLIGFTCSYDQTFASLALAKQIRQHMPDVLIALGGYAVNGETGEMVLRSFPFIDCVAQGDSELTIVDLAEASVGIRSLSEVRGIQYRAGNDQIQCAPTLRANLDDLPPPEFDDYYQDKLMLERNDGIRINAGYLPVETSRGCWWGQKHHCVFCGIDDLTMKYRSRTVDNVIWMLDTLHERYGVSFFRINDYILPHNYHKTLIRELIARPRPYRLACEAKANLTREQMRNMSLAGFTEVQPGIESFSSRILALMKKGVTASQNVLLLTWGRRYRVTIHFNILYGIPGERVVDYKEMVKLLPALYHLNPPASITITHFTRYSPLQEGKVAGSTGTTSPARRYRVVLSNEFMAATGFDMSKYCYHFESPYDPPEELKHWHRILNAQCHYWMELHKTRQVDLWFETKPEGIVFYDSRWSPNGEYIYGGPEMLKLYRLLTEGPIAHKWWYTESARAGVCEEAAEISLKMFLEKRLVVNIDDKLIGLALESCSSGEGQKSQKTS